MIPLAFANIEFGFAVVTWVVSSIVGAFVYGKIVGARQKGVDARIAEEAAARKAAIELEAATRKAEIGAVLQAIENLREADRLGRERIHRDIDAMTKRLDDGDHRFDDVTKLNENARTLNREITAVTEHLGSLVTEKVCAAKHQVLDSLGAAAGRLVKALDRLTETIDRRMGRPGDDTEGA